VAPRKSKPLYHGTPDSLPSRILDAGLGPACVGLNAIAYAESSRWALDGELSFRRVQSLAGWTQRREDDLVRAGIWGWTTNTVILLDYLAVNLSRSEIEARRELKAAAGSKGGTTRAALAAQRRDGAQRFRNGNGKQDGKHMLGPTATSPTTSTSSREGAGRDETARREVAAAGAARRMRHAIAQDATGQYRYQPSDLPSDGVDVLNGAGARTGGPDEAPTQGPTRAASGLER
jgi:hypothetical protein